LYQQENYQEAAHQFRQVLEVDPEYTLAHLHLCRALIALGEYEQAIVHATRASALSVFLADAFVALAHARAGRTREAEGTLAKLLEASRQHYVAPTLIAYLYVALRRSDSALGWFREAKKLRDPLLRLNGGSDPFLSDFRSVSEFQALLREE
jgi:tetratricopeptide (TPR) repeat protein